DATAQTYGLATFAQKAGERPRLKWAEGLEPEELAEAEMQVAAALAPTETAPEPQAGEHSICLALAVPTQQPERAAIYGRCVRPLAARQAQDMLILRAVGRLRYE